MQPVVGLLTGTSGVVARAGGLARATSTVGHWTGLGAYLLVALAVMCVLLSEKHARSRRTAVLSLVVILAGIVSTLTLAILIGATLLVILTFVQSSRLRHRLVPIALGGLLAAPLLAAPLLARLRQQFGSNPGAYAQSSGLIPESIAYRWEIWQNQTLPLIAERPLVGWGQGFYIELGTWPIFPYFVTWRSAESQYLLELVEGGLLQLAAFTGVLFTIALMFGWMSQGERKIIAMCFVTAVAAAFTVPIFTNVGLIGLLLPVLGVLLIGREHRSGAAGAKSRDVKWALS
ncbi:O-antigen ligase family protein [Curtobacterium sp. TXMA1]|uniref:O-antigen ligase family protein n=1 Tax=Curtobacterium sp. TXMA1 TaxID=2876939 RepID=UPI001CCB3F23|nr:O-antigen ligase family protein [Curtobacterium sp. TXMA1]UBQ03089.1 hypothetical protein LCG91_02665 [Curtobacterium sp. TXMA1]